MFSRQARDDSVDLSTSGGEMETIPAPRHAVQCALHALQHSQDTAGRWRTASPNTSTVVTTTDSQVLLLLLLLYFFAAPENRATLILLLLHYDAEGTRHDNSSSSS